MSSFTSVGSEVTLFQVSSSDQNSRSAQHDFLVSFFSFFFMLLVAGGTDASQTMLAMVSRKAVKILLGANSDQTSSTVRQKPPWPHLWSR